MLWQLIKVVHSDIAERHAVHLHTLRQYERAAASHDCGWFSKTALPFQNSVKQAT